MYDVLFLFLGEFCLNVCTPPNRNEVRFLPPDILFIQQTSHKVVRKCVRKLSFAYAHC